MVRGTVLPSLKGSAAHLQVTQVTRDIFLAHLRGVCLISRVRKQLAVQFLITRVTRVTVLDHTAQWSTAHFLITHQRHIFTWLKSSAAHFYTGPVAYLHITCVLRPSFRALKLPATDLQITQLARIAFSHQWGGLQSPTRWALLI